MYDPLTQSFRLTCPAERREVAVRLTRFRELERLPGPEHPPVYRVAFDCPGCGGAHPALVREHDLDVEAVIPSDPAVFLNLMTGRVEPVAGELVDLAERQLRRGNWPWSFYCAHEHAVRPTTPSSLRLIDPARRAADGFGVAVRCPGCGHVSGNVVSGDHLDRPFFHDPVLRYAPRTLDGAARAPERLRDELWSCDLGEERNRFAA